MIDRSDTRGARDVEIAYAVTTSAGAALLLVVAGDMVARWARHGGASVFWPLLVVAGAVLRIVVVLVRFDARRRSDRHRNP